VVGLVAFVTNLIELSINRDDDKTKREQ